MSCNLIKQGINARCDTSMGGILEVYLANADEWTYTESENTLDVSAANEGSGYKWYKYGFRKGSSSMSSTLNIDDANGINYVSTELVMTFGKMDTAKRVAISALATR